MFIIQIKKSIKYSLVLSFFVVTLLFAPFHGSHAASLNISPSSGTYGVGDDVTVRVKVGSGGTSVNAISGTIKFSSATLKLNSISKSGSIINLWAQDPTFSNSSGTASFEGVALSGYTGDSASVVVLNFTAKAVGQASISFGTSSILASDGQGTNVLSSSSGASFTINQAKIINTPKVEPIVETPVVNTEIANNAIKIDRVQDGSLLLSKSRFHITAPRKILGNLYYVQIDDGNTSSWNGEPNGIYETGILSVGRHIIKVSAKDESGKSLAGSLDFDVISKSLITDYSKKITNKEHFYVKGIIDSSKQIFILISSLENTDASVYSTSSDSTGAFSFINEQLLRKGIYSVSIYSVSQNGSKSSLSDPLPLLVTDGELSFSNLLDSNRIFDFAIIFLLIVIIVVLFRKNQKIIRLLNEKGIHE